MNLQLNWFSPTDGKSTEIANYSRMLMPWLARDCDVLNASQFLTQTEDEPIPASYDPGSAPPAIYHLGNSKMHIDICRRMKEEPGIVVLHDINLVDLAQNEADERGDYHSWQELFCAQYGEDVRDLAVRSEKWEHHEARTEIALRYPLFTPYLHGALGVVVHSAYAENIIRQQLPSHISIKQLNLPHPPPGPLPDRNYDEPVLRFVFCGHTGPNRRLESFIQAWGESAQPEKIQLNLYGNISMEEELTKQAEKQGLADRLHIHGFVEDSELSKALRCAHFALNLRWPTMGETSSSQLRYWSEGLPTIVSDVGWYNEVPDDTLLKIPQESEIPSLKTMLSEIAQSPEKYMACGEAGREYLKQVHSPATYCQELLGFAQQRYDALQEKTLDASLAPMLANMCEDFPTLDLFKQPLETAAELFGPRPAELEKQ